MPYSVIMAQYINIEMKIMKILDKAGLSEVSTKFSDHMFEMEGHVGQIRDIIEAIDDLEDTLAVLRKNRDVMSALMKARGVIQTGAQTQAVRSELQSEMKKLPGVFGVL